MTTQVENRLQTIRDIWRTNQGLYIVAGIFIGFLLYPALNIVFNDLFGLLENLIPEAVGIVFTVIFIDRLNQRREAQRRISEQKERLVREAGSQSNGTALSAVTELSKQGWLTGNEGLLQGADLHRANLQDANLWGTNLQGTDLTFANLQATYLQASNLQHADLRVSKLQGAILFGANLQGVNLQHANLQGAKLHRANLQGATLQHANLQGTKLHRANLESAALERDNLRGSYLSSANLKDATLRGSDLQGATLNHANLQDADLSDVTFDEETTLPDITKWTPDTDMTRFTNPEHPDFWRGYNLRKKNLQNMDLQGANLQGALLFGANLQSANLEQAKLQGANLINANLQDAELKDATFNQESTLPDDTNWTPDTDMTRFTDPEHPDFWRSDNRWSPAYKRDDDQTED